MPDITQEPAAPRGDSNATRTITELYSVHYRPLLRLAILLVRDLPTAEEVVQNSFVDLYASQWPLRDAEEVLTHLQQDVVRRSRAALRHRAVVYEDQAAITENLQMTLPDMPSAEHCALVLLDRHAVVAALRTLPDRQREAIVLRYAANMSEAEIANAMGISRGAVKSHTSRGMTALRAILESNENMPEPPD